MSIGILYKSRASGCRIAPNRADFYTMNSTKIRILEAARTVLIEQGSGAFSMRKVAAEANLALGNVQYHYKTKTDLLTELLAWYLSTYKNLIQQKMDEAAPGEEGLHRFIKFVLSEEEDSDEIKLSLAIVSAAEEEILVKQLDVFYGDFYALLAVFLGRIAEKPVRSVCIKKAASVLLTVINGYGMASQQLGVSTKVMSDELTAMIWSRLTAG